MENRKIIGLTGFAGQGKNTVASIIEKNGENWETISFAMILKDATAILFGWDRKMLEGIDEESRKIREIPDEYWSQKFGRPFSPRTALQELGTNLIRTHWLPDFWVATIERYIKNSKKNILVADCRFPNEVKAIKEMGGEVWLINIGDLPKHWNALCEYNKTGVLPKDSPITLEELQKIHASEREWVKPVSEFDAYINPPKKGLDILENIVNKVAMERNLYKVR